MTSFFLFLCLHPKNTNHTLPQNPFDAREAKVYQSEPDIAAIGNLRTAYEKVDVKAFTLALDAFNKTADKFIRTHIDSMVRDFQARAVLSIVRPYSRVTLASLANALHVDPPKIEQIVVQLLLDGDLIGSLHQSGGILNLTQPDVAKSRKFQAMHALSSTLNKTTRNLTHQHLYMVY